jgi:hypothetical protein
MLSFDTNQWEQNMENERHPGELIDAAMLDMELRMESYHPIRFTINATQYEVAQYHEGWSWVTDTDEAACCFYTAWEAQRDAIRTEQMKVWDAEEAAEDAINDGRYGTYQQQHTLYGEGY